MGLTETDFYNKDWYYSFHNSPNRYCHMVIIRWVLNCIQCDNSKTEPSKEVQGDTSLKYPSLLSVILETNNSAKARVCCRWIFVLYLWVVGMFSHFRTIKSCMYCNQTEVGPENNVRVSDISKSFALYGTDQTFYIDSFVIFWGLYRNYPLYVQGRQLHTQTAVNGIRCDRVRT